MDDECEMNECRLDDCPMDECAVCLEPMFVITGKHSLHSVMQLEPLFSCQTCLKHTHWKCMDESVCSSLKAVCPLCRAPFTHPVVELERLNTETIVHAGIDVLHFMHLMQPHQDNDDANWDVDNSNWEAYIHARHFHDDEQLNLD